MYNYNPYNQYAQQYNMSNNYLGELQQMRERIDKQIQQAQQPQQQIQPVQPSVTQTFQLAPQSNNNNELEGRYAENIDEVKNTFVMKTGIFATKDYSTIWVKNVSGDITTYKTEQVVEMDKKDIQIQNLQKELEEMKMIMAKSIKPEEEIKPKVNKSK